MELQQAGQNDDTASVEALEEEPEPSAVDNVKETGERPVTPPPTEAEEPEPATPEQHIQVPPPAAEGEVSPEYRLFGIAFPSLSFSIL